MKTAVTTLVLSILALGAILMTASLIFCRPILSAINTPENVFADSAVYVTHIYLRNSFHALI